MPIDYPRLGIFYPVPRDPTPLPERELAVQFVVSYMHVTGKKPGSRTLLYNALAIIGVENGSGSYILNHNWGNIMADPASWRGPAWPHPQPSEGQPFWFRAYDDHDAGAEAWWRLMLSRYRPVLQRAAAGDTLGMVRQLYALGYVHGNQPAYERLASALVPAYERQRLFQGMGPLRSDWVGMGSIAAGVAAAMALGVTHVGR